MKKLICSACVMIMMSFTPFEAYSVDKAEPVYGPELPPAEGEPGFIGPVRPRAPAEGEPGFIGAERPPVVYGPELPNVDDLLAENAKLKKEIAKLKSALYDTNDALNEPAFGPPRQIPDDAGVPKWRKPEIPPAPGADFDAASARAKAVADFPLASAPAPLKGDDVGHTRAIPSLKGPAFLQ